MFTIIALIFSIHFYKNRYPKEFDEIIQQILSEIQKNETLKPYLPALTNICYNLIYVYSFCQITLNNIIQFCIPYIQLATKSVTKMISSTPNTNASTSTSTPNISLVTTDYNLVLVKSLVNDMIILDKLPSDLNALQYEPSNIRFLALYMKMLNDDSKHIIELFNKDMNFYIVGNVINSEFLKYYLQNILQITVDKNSPFTYTLELMDQNIEMVYLNETQSIVLKKDDYEVIEPVISVTEVKEVIKETPIEVKELVKETSIIEVIKEVNLETIYY
jgi:hypothetical protein